MQGTPVPQTLPHEPQLFRSLTVSTQVVPQSSPPPGQGLSTQPQLLKSSTCPEGQETQASPQSAEPLGQEQLPEDASLQTDPIGQQTAPQTTMLFGQMQVQVAGSTTSGSVQVRSQGGFVGAAVALPSPEDWVGCDCDDPLAVVADAAAVAVASGLPSAVAIQSPRSPRTGPVAGPP